jgi:hypothetical protein
MARPRAAPSEHSLQVTVLDYLTYNAHRDLYWFAIPNAARRSLRMGARMKAEGLQSGVADLCIMLPDGKVIWLELKTGKGRQSLAQKGFQARCERLGHPYGLVWTFDDAVAFLDKHGVIKP